MRKLILSAVALGTFSFASAQEMTEFGTVYMHEGKVINNEVMASANIKNERVVISSKLVQEVLNPRHVEKLADGTYFLTGRNIDGELIDVYVKYNEKLGKSIVSINNAGKVSIIFV